MIKAIFLPTGWPRSFQSCKGQSSSPALTSAGFAYSINSRYFDIIPNAHPHSLCPKDICENLEISITFAVSEHFLKLKKMAPFAFSQLSQHS